jgi:hypothetical protein
VELVRLVLVKVSIVDFDIVLVIELVVAVEDVSVELV